MDLPRPVGAFGALGTLSALARFVRQRLAEEGDLLGAHRTSPVQRDGRDAVAVAGGAPARQVALAIVTAAAPFAPTPQARTRLLRQMHACGLLSAREAEQTRHILQLGDGRIG